MRKHYKIVLEKKEMLFYCLFQCRRRNCSSLMREKHVRARLNLGLFSRRFSRLSAGLQHVVGGATDGIGATWPARESRAYCVRTGG